MKAYPQLTFQFPFRTYQQQILDQIKQKSHERKYHIVSPPGSGKTIVGLELIIRSGQPAVVFAPTTTIALQWKQKVQLFLPPESNLDIDDVVSLDPNNLKLINIFTYQLLSSPAENLQFIEQAALENWTQALVTQNTVENTQAAKRRIATLKKNNPSSYNKELKKYYKRIKDHFLEYEADFFTQNDSLSDILKLYAVVVVSSGSIDLLFEYAALLSYLVDQKYLETEKLSTTENFLHANSRKLIKDITELKVASILLDEAHHLLDYWAMILKHLMRKNPQAKMIGLTATPPLSADDDGVSNYVSLVGDIDFEIPTPAVVKEGNLAPYQDLVYFCTPSQREKQFIGTLQEQFISLVTEIGETDEFRTWLLDTIIARKTTTGATRPWSKFFNYEPTLAIASIKYLLQYSVISLPSDIIVIEEMERELELEDWVTLLTHYSLHFLQLSEDTKHHQQLKQIKATLKSFGFVLTEKGIRKYRSPSDAVLAFSENKNKAVVNILQTEMQAMGEKLRAVVITDFEKQSATATKLLQSVHDEHAGGAVKTFQTLVQDSKVTKLEPVLVTGSAVLVDTDELPRIIKEIKKWKKDHDAVFTITTKKTEHPNIVEIEGSGSGWKTSTYVRMMTDLFEAGIVKCIVGTRALLGEGWDSLSLNTLIDLTSATTAATVNQVRGRSIRLDPKWPTKVANNWDVVCIASDFEKGDQDFLRFLRKHRRFYGLNDKKQVVKGYQHVDAKLQIEYQTLGFKKILYKSLNDRMLKKAALRDKAYKAWEVGKPYSNFRYTATKIEVKDFKFQTAFTLRDSLKAIFNSLLMSIVSALVWYFYIFGNISEAAIGSRIVLLILGNILVITIISFSVRHAYRYIRKAFIELPIDSFILDIGKAVLLSLRDAKFIASNQTEANLRVVEDVSGYLTLFLDYASPEDARLFSNSFSQTLAPVTDQRYLIARSIDYVPIGFYTPIWWFFRKVFRIFNQQQVSYHAVPDVLASKKKYALIYADHWSKFVGGSKLIFTRSNKGKHILLSERSRNKKKIRRLLFEGWK